MGQPKMLCDSITSKPMPKWLSALAIAFGLALAYQAFRDFRSIGLNLKVVYNIAIALICVYGAGISRRLYLSDIGVVREMHAWGRVIRRVLPWKDIAYVTLGFRGNRMMAFFEIGTMGWKVMFSRDQKEEVREILREYIPSIDVHIMEKASG